jgi:thiamine-phosphate pyrophosphorylase
MPATRTDPERPRAGRLAGLYAITPERGDADALVTCVRAAIDGGARAVQYRRKGVAPGVQRMEAARLAALCRERGALFIVNDDPALAAAVRADGVHVGEDDADLTAAREAVGRDALVGVSCYNDIERARRAVAGGADYVAFGSLFASAVKPGARRATLELVREGVSLGVPVVGIGGIDASNAASVIEAGAAAVAVISAVFDGDDVAAAAARIARECDAGARRRAGLPPRSG